MPAVRHRPSPLPWMLLTVSIALTVGVLFLGKVRLDEERARYASALKANDEVQAKLRQAISDREKVKLDLAAREDANAELSKKIVTLEMQIQRLEDDLAKAKPPKK